MVLEKREIVNAGLWTRLVRTGLWTASNLDGGGGVATSARGDFGK